MIFVQRNSKLFLKALSTNVSEFEQDVGGPWMASQVHDGIKVHLQKNISVFSSFSGPFQAMFSVEFLKLQCQFIPQVKLTERKLGGE